MHGFIERISKVLECYSYLENASKMCDTELENQRKKRNKNYTLYNYWANQYNENLNLIKNQLSSLNNYICVCNEKNKLKNEL